MSDRTTLRSSNLRLGIGASLLLASLVVGLWLLPGASQERDVKRKAAREAQTSLARQMQELEGYQTLADQIRLGQQKLEDLENHMPKGSIGDLHWSLSKTLYELAAKHGVRLQYVKYGLPSRDSAKGTGLESLDVEFSILGVYQSVKPFMLALEGSGLPFAVVSARMEESPEGARMNVVLRAFRRSSGTPEKAGEEAA